MHIYNKIHVLLLTLYYRETFFLNSNLWFYTYDKFLPKDGTINVETLKTVLIIINVFYCIFVFCWYIKDIILFESLYSGLRMEHTSHYYAKLWRVVFVNKNVLYSARQGGEKLLTGQKCSNAFIKMYFIISRSICNSKNLLL